MLITPGDLIPVQSSATSIPWTRRKSQILNFLHRGPVTFNTLVYDTNVGDISALSTYFNPERISVKDLNSRFGHHPNSSGSASRDENVKVGSENVLKPRLLLYPEHTLNSQAKVQRTLKWILSHQEAEESLQASSLDQLPASLHQLPASLHQLPDNLAEQKQHSVQSRHPSNDSLNKSQGSMRTISRPGSSIGQNARLTPIGQPMTESLRITGQACSLPSNTDSVWKDLPREERLGIDSGWGSWQPTETAW